MNHNDDLIYGVEPEQVTNLLVGKSVKSIHGPNLELNDGTVLTIEDADLCCAWYAGEWKAIDLSDNIITGCKTTYREDGEDTEDGLDGWTLTILSNNKQIASLEVEGDPASGYYVSSIDLRVGLVEYDEN